MRAEHFVLPQHHPVIAYLVFAGCEVAMPEESQLLFERPPRRQHPVRPPQRETLRLNLVGVQAVEEFVDDRLKPALRAFWQHLLTETFAVLTCETDRLRAARRER